MVSRFAGADLVAEPVTVVAVAPLLWAVFDFDTDGADAEIGHIDCDGDRYRVGLADEDLQPYSFATLRECRGWFDEYRWALSLGRTEKRSHA